MKVEDWLVREVLAAIPNWERSWLRQQQLQALKLRRKWKTADIEKLRQLNLPNAEQLTQKPLQRGRPVVAPLTSLDDRIVSDWKYFNTLFNPATPPCLRRNLYRKSRWFPEFVEQAYRGELEQALSRGGSSNRNEPHFRASEIAEEEVAKAAGISTAQVRKLCHQARKGYRGASPPPPTCAADLEKHLELGPALARTRSKHSRDLI